MKGLNLELFKEPEIAKHIVFKINQSSKKYINIMEVCGTHTVSIFRNGIRSILPKTISLCSGPGCPVCVTSQKEIDMFIELSKQKDTIITTFGDLIRVPGSISTLQEERIKGADVRIVYSTFDALEIAKENVDKKIIFIGIGFETTAPTIAAAIIRADQLNIKNFYVISAHKVVPPALEALAGNVSKVDAFILPGHVSAIIGANAYKNFFNKFRLPCVIAGFEPIDLLEAIFILVSNLESKKFKFKNAYSRVVTPEGNRKAMKLLNEVFKIKDTTWRGIGNIKDSGLFIKDKYSKFDASKVFDIKYKKHPNVTECICGEILTGMKSPIDCILYKKKCTPMNPVGPCMVSTEGTCAAFYNYN